MNLVVRSILVFIFCINFLSAQNNTGSANPAQLQPKSYFASIKGIVLDKETGEPLSGANVYLRQVQLGAATNRQGFFRIENVPFGRYTLVVEYMGYASKAILGINIQEKEPLDLNIIRLQQKPMSLQEIVVTPGAYSVMGNAARARVTLSEKDIKMMGWAEDVTRALERLPGVSSNDFSAKFNIRGGDVDEVLVQLDGMQIYDPFHQKDFAGGLFSTVDIEALGGVDLLTGGFGAEYGDRLSGVLNMKTQNAASGKSTSSIGISLINARAFSMGSADSNKITWLFSARRGFLDLLNSLMQDEFKLKPTYYDMLGKLAYKLNPKQTLTVYGFLATDAYRLHELEYEPQLLIPNKDYSDTRYGNNYGWLTLNSNFTPRLSARTIAYTAAISKDRRWDRLDNDPKAQFTQAYIKDGRSYHFWGFKQDWNWQLHPKLLVKFGADWKQQAVRYKYTHQIDYEYVSPQDSLVHYLSDYRADFSKNGWQSYGYFALRYQLFKPLIAEGGLRFDANSYYGEHMWSPRLNLVYMAGKNTFIRAGWGTYYQSQGIEQLQIQFRKTDYHSAQQSNQYSLGLEKQFSNGLQLRMEAYQKEMSHVPESYYTFANIDEFYPEARNDLFKVDIARANSKGIELYLKYDRGQKVSWWLSYVWAKAMENYSAINYPGKIEANPGQQPRPWDQRHTINADLNYHFSKKWDFSLSWQYHSGWPYTPFQVKRIQRTDGSWSYYHEFGIFNGKTYPSYQRLDARINRYYYLRGSRINTFLHIINLYNHKNILSYDHDIINPESDDYKVKIIEETWFGITPFLGVSWEF